MDRIAAVTRAGLPRSRGRSWAVSYQLFASADVSPDGLGERMILHTSARCQQVLHAGNLLDGFAVAGLQRHRGVASGCR